MDSLNYLNYENHLTNNIFPNKTDKLRTNPKSTSKDKRSPNEIQIKKYEIKLPNFQHVKIRDPSENFEFLIEKEKQNRNKKNCYCKYEEDELYLKEVFGVSLNKENKENLQAEKVEKIKFDFEDAEKIKKILEEKEFVFKKQPEVFNSSYIKKYQKFKSLLYISFLKNKDVIYNYDKSSNTYSASNEHKCLFDGNDLNDQEEKEFLIFLKQNFSKMQSNYGFNNDNNNNNLKNENFSMLANSVKQNGSLINEQIKNNVADKNNENYNNDLKANIQKAEIINDNNFNNNNNIIFSSSDNNNNNSNIIYDHSDKIKLQNKYLVDKNKLRNFAKKKQMQTVNLNENLVNNLNFEISKINENTSSSNLKEVQIEKRPNSHNLYSIKKNNFFNNYNNNTNNNYNCNSNYYNDYKNISKLNLKNTKESIRLVKVQERNSSKSPLDFSAENTNRNSDKINSNNLNIKIHREINERNNNENFNNDTNKENKISMQSKVNTKKTLPKISSCSENDIANNNKNNNNNFKDYKTNSDTLNKNEKCDRICKSKETGSNTNSIDTKLLQNNNSNKNTKNDLKNSLDENIKLAHDEKGNREDINFFNFHSDISTDRFGIFAKIEQKDFKDNFIRLKDHLEHNTIQNKILVSHKNHKSFTNNFFRKNKETNIKDNNKNNNNFNETKNNYHFNINVKHNNNDKNPMLKTEAILTNINSDTTQNKIPTKPLSSENLIESESKTPNNKALSQNKNQNKNLSLNIISNNLFTSNPNFEIINKIKNENHNKNYINENPNPNKDFCPVSRMLHTNYSWGDKLIYLKTPTSIYNSTKEGLRTHCSVNNNEFLQNYFKGFQKTSENKMRNIFSKNSSSSEKYLFSFNSNFREKYFNSKEKKDLLSDFEQKNLYSEDNLKKPKSESKHKANQNDLNKIKSALEVNDHCNIDNQSIKNNNNKFINFHEGEIQNDIKNINNNNKFEGLSSKDIVIKLNEDAILSRNKNKNNNNKQSNKKYRIPLQGFQDSKTFGNEICNEDNTKNMNNNNNKNNNNNNENIDNNSISYNNTLIENINSKKSFMSNSNRGQNSNYNSHRLKQHNSNQEAPLSPKNLDSILSNSINLNDIYDKFDLKQSLKITSQNGKKNKIIFFEIQNAQEKIMQNSNNKNPIAPRKSSKIQLFRELIKTPPLPLAMENFNQNIKTRKAPGFSASNTSINFYKNSKNKIFNSEKFEKISLIDQDNLRLRNELSNRYRKKKINIEEVLVLHNTNIRKQLNPLKTQEFHMKFSMHRKDKLFGLKRTAKQNCFNKSETYQLKRENLNKFEKPM